MQTEIEEASEALYQQIMRDLISRAAACENSLPMDENPDHPPRNWHQIVAMWLRNSAQNFEPLKLGCFPALHAI